MKTITTYINYLSIHSYMKKTTLLVSEETRDRVYKLKFRKTYELFLNELCDLFESKQ